MNRTDRIIKRAFDLAILIPALVVIVPLSAVVAGLVWVRIGRPVFFRQVRPGLHGRPFTLWKFRTMAETVDEQGQPLPDERRLLPFGRFLRSTSLDELPSVWNVLKGDMSLVGPRPLLLAYLDLYSPEQARRHDVLPGLTGLAQVEGRNALPWPARLRLDTDYVDRWSVGLDVRILMRTVGLVFRRHGVNQDGHATVERFRGNDAHVGQP